MNFINLTKLLVFVGLYFIVTTSFAQNKSLNTPINISFEQEELKDCLLQLEEKMDLTIAFNSEKKLTQKISKSYANTPINKILDDLLIAPNLSYKIVGNSLVIYANKKTQKTSVNLTPPKAIVISGYVYDERTGEVLIGANIYESDFKNATTSNQFGFFSLSVKKESAIIHFSYLGYNNYQVKVTQSQELIVKLLANNQTLEAVIVTAKEEEENEKLTRPAMSTHNLQMEEVKQLPALAGETDVLKTLTLLPSIKQGEDGAAGFYVRGGNIDQNLILMDGIPLYNPYHLFGFLSTFNPDAINDIEIIKGAFPARYGGRVSSVIDVSLKEGNNQKWETNLSVSLLAAKATVSGPLVKDKSSILISARRTILDLPYRLLIASTADENQETKHVLNFADLNLKWNYRFSTKDRLYIATYFSNDVNDFNDTYSDTMSSKDYKVDQRWKNGMASLRWNHLYSNKLFSNTTAYFSHYSFNYLLGDNYTSEERVISSVNTNEIGSKINDFGLKQDYHLFLNQKNETRFGIGGVLHNYEFSVRTKKQENNTDDLYYETPKQAMKDIELSSYLEHEWEVHPQVKINGGLHASAFLASKKTYYSMQPRLSMSYLINDNVSLKLGYAQMTQYAHLLSKGNLVYKSDFWILSSDKIKPINSTQYSLGTYFSLGKQFSLSVEGYYKTMENLINFKPGASFILQEGPVEDKITQGSGKSYGGEFLFQKTKGRFTGWLGYTLAWSTRQFEDINFGKTFYDIYDRRHDLSLVGNYSLNDKWSLNSVFVFSTGGFSNFSTHSYITPNYNPNATGYNVIYGADNTVTVDGSNGNDVNNPTLIHNTSNINEYRLPNYHRLDITAIKKITTKRKRQAELKLGITNLYNNFNPSFYKPNFGENEEVKSKYVAVSIFPFMPFVNYSITF